MALRAFVTRELFPFTAGGIGRVVANILATSSAEERASMAVVFVGEGVDERAFQSLYPEARFLAVVRGDYEHVDAQANIYPPVDAFSTSRLHWESLLILQALRALERRGESLEYVEFVDWGAAGFAAIQQKRLGTDFTGVTLAVRLHTTDSVLATFEKRTADVHGLALYDLERKALADCDLIVGQLAPVAEAMRKYYGFTETEWFPRLAIHAPPVLLDALPPAERSTVFGVDTPIVFSSKLQDIKRPDVFVRACVDFMLATPDYKGEARFLAHSFDSTYRDSIKKLVPKQLAERFVFLSGLVGVARERIIADAVCVFPSPWESFCLAAYEASMLGGLCILNGANPAFGDETPWLAGVNCFKFEGSSQSLASSLTLAFQQSTLQRLSPVRPPTDVVPWSIPRPEPTHGVQCEELTMIVAHRGDGSGLLATLESIATSSSVPTKVIVLDDGSKDPLSRELLDRLEQAGGPLQVICWSEARGMGAAFNAALAHVATPLVGFVSAGSVVAPGFLSTAVKGLARNPEFDIVTGQQGYGVALEDLASPGGQDPWRYWVVYGEARACGHIQNRYAADIFVMRESRARHRKFDESLYDRAGWEFLLSCIAQGARCLVSSSIAAVRRANATVDNAAGRAPWIAAVAYGELLSDKQISYGRLVLPAYTFATGANDISGAPVAADEYQRLYMELRSSETVRAALFVAQTLQQRAPWALAAIRPVMSWAVSMRRR